MNTNRALRSCLALVLAGYLALSPTLTTLAYAAELEQDESGSAVVVEDEEEATEETAEAAEAEEAAEETAEAAETEETTEDASDAAATSEAATAALAAECETSTEATASAASADEVTASLSATEQASIDTSNLPDSDELAEGYIESALAGDDALSLLANYGITYLGSDEDALALYYELVAFVQDIAANGGSTQYSYTVSDTCAYDDFSTAFYEIKDEQAEIISKVLDCLLVDCPYDFYWYDKTTGLSESFGGSYSGTATSGTITVTVTLSFSPASAYAGTSSYTVVTPATSIATAAATAQAIVDEYAGTANVATKLTAYKDEICALVSYNSDAASDSYEDGYGDPWQLIYVFDGDDTTNVVCEGYSKAFQYLCDLTWPSNDPVTCYIVTGTLTGGTGAGGHMWNLVAVDGASWLVDVTNSDSGTVGQNGGLFLVGTSDDVTGSVSEGYTFTGLSTTVSFAYYDDTITLYGEEILTLTSEEFPSTLGLASIEDAEVALEAANFVYTGSAIEPEVTVTLDGVELELGVDYTVAYADNVKMGDATVTVTGTGDYTGSVELTFTIADECTVNGHSWDEGTVTAEATCTEEGVRTYTCTVCGETYTEAIEATGHSEAEAVAENEVAATCTAAGSYDSVVYCSVCGEELSRETVAIAATGHSWDEGSVTVEATCTEDGTIIYTCSTCGETYTEAIEATGHSEAEAVAENEVAATCTAAGSYDSVVYCSVCGEEVSRETVATAATGHSWDEGSVTAEATCTEGGEIVYTCSVCDETYTETIAATGHSWDEGAVTAEATCTEDGEIVYTCENDSSHTYTEAIAATGHTAASAVVENEVAATCTAAGSYDSVVYCSVCGAEISRETVSIAATGHSWDSGTVTTAATCTATGVRTYTCSACGATKTSSIAALGHSYVNNVCSRCGALKSSTVGSATVTLGYSSATYTGSALTPSVTVKVNGTTLTQGTDYTVSYSNNTNVGTATVTVKGAGSYSGSSTSKDFTITAASIASYTVSLSKTSYTYSGSACEPTVTLKNGSTTVASSNYSISYSDNTNKGTATVTVTGTGNYTGTVTKTFTIKARSITKATVKLSSSSMSYTGSALKPTVKSLTISGTTYSGLTKGTDYTISYSSNKNVGTATVKITGTGNFSGSVKTTFAIKKASISSSTFTVALSSSSYTYNGKARKPTVTVTNSNGVKISSSNYTVSYASGRKAIGKYKVTIKAKGSNLKGSTSVYFTIKPGKVSISSLKSSAAKKLTVKWKKLSGSVKYQIAYRVKGTSTWKYKTVSASTVSKTISGLTGGKTYQVRVRAYKKVSGTTYYGSWSTTKTVKVKSGGSLTSSTVVYVIPSGSKYHSTTSCTGLNAAKSISKTTYGKIKDSYSACSICW